MHKAFTEHWLIRGLSSEAKSALYRLGELLEINTDQVVIEANTPNQELFLLLEGAFKVNLPDRRGRMGGITLGHRGPGDLLGEYSFIDSFKPTATVTASTPGLVLRIHHEDMRELLTANSEVSSIVYRNMLKYLVARLRAQDEEFDCYMF